MLLETELLQASMDKLIGELRTDAASGGRTPQITASLTHNLKNSVTFTQHGREFAFDSDELEVLGGEGTAPSPMRFFLSGIAFCQSVWYAKGAVLAGCELTELAVTITTHMDVRGEHKVADDVPSNPQWFRFEVTVRSESPAAAVLQAVDEGDVRCPLGSLVRLAVPVYSRVVLNDEVIRDETPDEVLETLQACPPR